MRNRPGFTLAEILVMLAIMAVLAAVLVPTITNQIRKGDVNAISGDLTSLRGGIEAYVSDVHRYPASLQQLIDPTAVTGGNDVLGNAIPSGLSNRWGGPYIDRVDVTGGLTTGFGGVLKNTFGTTTINGVPYLRVDITGVDEADFADVDEVIDGSANSTTGRLRWVTASSTIQFMALPVN